jgi:hypothetical protein
MATLLLNINGINVIELQEYVFPLNHEYHMLERILYSFAKICIYNILIKKNKAKSI